jgi:hypothetical protein
MLCAQINVTWYPGAVGSTDDPLVLLSLSHYVPGPGNLSALMEQMVQAAEYHRGASVDHFARGNARLPLSIEEWRKVSDPLEAHETALALLAGLPQVTGWLLVEIESRDTTWSIDQAVIRSLRYEVDERRGLLKLTWSVDCGALAVYEGEDPPSVWPYGSTLLGPNAIGGVLLLGPNRTIAG